MAEFPYPEYRNLWAGSMLSKDRSALATNAWSDGGKQVDDGLEVTITSESAGAQSPAYTTGGYRVGVESGKAYSLAVPFKNSGAVDFPVRITAYFDPSGWETSGLLWLRPGESRVVKIENMIAPSDGTIRFSWRVDTEDPRLPVGGKLTLLDGITLVQSATAPDFPFSGERIYPVETLKRRNINRDPINSRTSDLSGYRTTSDIASLVVDEGENAIQLVEGDPANTTIYIDPERNWTSADSLAAGRWLAHSAEVKSVNGHYSTTDSIARVMSYGGGATGAGDPVADPATSPDLYKRMSVARPITSIPEGAYFRTLIWPHQAEASGQGFRVRRWVVAVADSQSAALAAVATYFDGDTPASGKISYRWAPDGTSLEIETIKPPEGRTVVWDGEPYKSTSTLWVGDSIHATGVMDIGAATDARLGIVSDIYSRSQEKIKLVLATPDENLVSGRRVELSAAAYTATSVVWRWRQITGPAVDLEPRDNNVDFLAPDVDEETVIRIGVYAISEDGRNRSDWHYFDLPILPPTGRFLLEGTAEYVPAVPSIAGYGRGRREVWNDVVRPPWYSSTPRNEVEVVDLGITPDDVQFSVEQPESCAAGGVYINPETGDVFRNFGAGYNETNDTTGAPRTNAYWLNPATGDILEWRGA